MIIDFLKFCLVIVALGVICTGPFILGANLLSSYQCNNYQRVTGVQTKYVALDTCYVHTAKGWQRWDEYKTRAIASEGLAK